MRQIVAPDRKQFLVAVFKSIQAIDIKPMSKSKTSLSNGKEKTKPKLLMKQLPTLAVQRVGVLL